MVENYQHQTSVNRHGDFLAQVVAHQLDLHNVPDHPAEKLQSLRDSDRRRTRPCRPTRSPGRRRRTGALRPTAQQRRPPLSVARGSVGQAAATVKIIDANTGDTLWPWT